MMKPTYYDAVLDLVGGRISGESDGPLNTFLFIDEQPPPTEEEVQTRLASMISEWNAQEYARNRQAEFPSIQDLVVALYDTDDKSAIEAKRAAVKKKYPKPS